ncbi:MAG TPA: NAD(P)H-dependent oxidoreductase [Geminicoccaceae bacterium]|nr:NAD(P)H-dependent oxidoreductase [Geminicoccus sp.]HMU49952.1 NAD(P)H-dependent oxidoreductase [Geminicoccaceae bacterium]
MTMPLRLALIYGSTREGRFCDTVAEWATARIAARPEMELDVIDPLELGLPAHYQAQPGEQVTALRQRIDRADGFVVVTPEYNHSFPAALKFVIDLAGAPWRAKPVGFVSYGGVSGGLRAVEHLRGVFAELHAVGIRDCVSFAMARGLVDGQGRFAPPEASDRAMTLMLNELAWWAEALRAARERRPYAEAIA